MRYSIGPAILAILLPAPFARGASIKLGIYVDVTGSAQSPPTVSITAPTDGSEISYGARTTAGYVPFERLPISRQLS
jgi:hypothetical protein